MQEKVFGAMDFYPPYIKACSVVAKEEEEEWHAGMVPNLRPKSEKGLEEEDS